MDKGHLNNYISKMKGYSREAIRRTYQKVKKNKIKLINLIEKVKNEKKLHKIQNQIKRFEEEEIIIKSIRPDEITKIALVIPCFNDLLSCNELSVEEKIKLQIAKCDIVQKIIGKFKRDFPDSEQYIDVTIDLLDVKKIMKSYKNKKLVKQLDNQLKQRRNILKHFKIINKIDETLEKNELREQNEQKIKKIMKRIKISDSENGISDNIDNLIFKEKIDTKRLDVDGENSKENKKETNDIKDIIMKKFKIKKNENGLNKEENKTIDEINQHFNKKIVDPDFREGKDENTDSECKEQNTIDLVDKKYQNANYFFRSQQFEQNYKIGNHEIVDNDLQHDELSHDELSHDDLQHDELSHDELSHDELSHDELSHDELSHDELAVNKSINEKLKESTKCEKSKKILDIQEASKEYLKRQLIKVFGEKLANKTSKDVSSDEEWVDDFFINKKVKKFKSTIVDIERYKDLAEKEKTYFNKFYDQQFDD